MNRPGSPRRRAARSLAGALLAFAASVHAYPTQPVRIVVPHPPGVGVDVQARALATSLARELGQPVLVENRPGFGTLLSMETVAKARPDGHTVGIGIPSSLTAHPRLFDRPPFDVERDLVPVAPLWTFAWALYVHPSVPATTLAEFVELVRGRPGAYTYATTGVGSFQHLTTEWLLALVGGQMRHVPYGATPWAPDLLAGRVQVVQWTLAGLGEQARAGALRMLAVSNGARRSEQFPDVPTFAQGGVASFDATAWAGMVVPAGTPEPVVERLAAAVARAVRQPEFVELVTRGGGSIATGTPAGFAAFLRTERDRWRTVIADAAIRLD